MSFKRSCEVIEVYNSDVERNALHLKLGCGEKVFGILHSTAAHVLGEGNSDLLFKDRGKIAEMNVSSAEFGRKDILKIEVIFSGSTLLYFLTGSKFLMILIVALGAIKAI